jgi:hypothetical protein
MTVTAETTNRSQLTDHDHIDMTGDNWSDASDYALPWSQSTSFHVRPQTPIRVRVHEDQNRVVVRLGAMCADLDVYANADQLDRLITLLSAARQRLP